MSTPLAVIVLAAGQGTRMKSETVKVLHQAAGRPLLDYSLRAAEALSPERQVVVVGRDAERVSEAFADRAEFVVQEQQRGTGHAVATALPLLEGFEGSVLILYGDVPLLRPESLERMRAWKQAEQLELVILSAPVPLPGRIVRGADGRVERIVETTDASPEELLIQEGNTGVYLVDASLLRPAIAALDDRNEQGELYLTDIVLHAAREKRAFDALVLEDPDESLGVNTRAELAAATRVLYRRNARQLMEGGVTIVDPDHTYVDADVEVGPDTTIEPGCVVTGPTRIGSGARIRAYSVIEESELGDGVAIGPCAHLRPGSRLGTGVRIGNFVEVKNSVLGDGVKADHLSYIGDADVGAGASFGCGSIVVNYDGFDKHRTRVGEEAFIGCNVNLVAPLAVEAGSFVAAGSTVTKDVGADSLVVARTRQKEIPGWVSRRKKAREAGTGKAAAESESGSAAITDATTAPGAADGAG